MIFRQQRVIGITPAYAGKRHLVPLVRVFPGDHPRVCGEKARRGDGLNLILGSPPRMRGKVQNFKVTGREFGVTPAYAGKSVKMPT